MTLDSKLRELAAASADSSAWRPTLFDLSRAYDRRVVVDLMETRRIVRVCDTLFDQLRELCATRAPSLRLSGDELDAVVQEHLGGARLTEYGTWVHYPWSGTLVHVLPEAEYRELRGSRNAYKITPEEQRRLRRFTVGVVGLSVGQSSAITLALEGIGGKLRVADFDTLSLSNMNRLRAAVSDVGTHKYAIAAREAFEIDPYLQIEVFPKGLHEDSVDAFLTGHGKERLSLLIEECDDLYVKFLVRERCKALRIPIVMETSDRGMIDVERYDLEPDRPLFHGMIQGIRASDVKAMPPPARVPMVLRIIGQGGLGGRVSASLLEVGETLASWPQLASSVALGGALTTDVARRILLDHFRGSGRYFVDLEAIISDGGAADLTPATALDDALRRDARLMQTPPTFARAQRTVTAADIRLLVAHGALAPSRGNEQPWWFLARLPGLHRPGRLRCYAAGEPSFLDVNRSLTHIALGAAVENMELSARAQGMSAALRAFPDPEDPSLVCELTLSIDPDAAAPPLAEQITRRATSRKPDQREPIPDASRSALSDAAASLAGRLVWITDPDPLDEIGSIQGAVERIERLTKPIHEQLFREIRFTQAEAEGGLDGLDITAIDLPPPDLIKLWLVRSWPAMETIASASAGRGFERSARMLLRATPAVALLLVNGADRESYFRGGRALQRVWLTATSMGLSIHPLSTLISLFARVARGETAGLSDKTIDELRALRRRYLSLFDVAPTETEIILLRVHRGGPPAIRSLRRHVGSMLAFEDARGHRTRPTPPKRS